MRLNKVRLFLSGFYLLVYYLSADVARRFISIGRKDSVCCIVSLVSLQLRLKLPGLVSKTHMPLGAAPQIKYPD